MTYLYYFYQTKIAESERLETELAQRSDIILETDGVFLKKVLKDRGFSRTVGSKKKWLKIIKEYFSGLKFFKETKILI